MKEERIKEFTSLMSGAMGSSDAEAVKKRLDDIGFFSAPASVKYHGNYEGGLFDHSLAVTKALIRLTKQLDLAWERPRSPYIVGMLHDLCKCDQYILNGDGTYSFNKNLTLTGHGDKSVILAQKMIELTDEETACIRWHMGAFDSRENWGKYGAAVEKYPNVLYTHTADMTASRICGI